MLHSFVRTLYKKYQTQTLNNNAFHAKTQIFSNELFSFFFCPNFIMLMFFYCHLYSLEMCGFFLAYKTYAYLKFKLTADYRTILFILLMQKYTLIVESYLVLHRVNCF
ncbi:hypothetical protein XELAEV_18009683mg [Xenopus laevis]|uniref:Uncharacterized protein n=1 Tax=Xenopus laevis TaxID=8355 RepID=A0A974I0T5_XENLA|nr:hypothetical protein XELAEV_18009683mg [Xenopus laevis]